MADAVDSRLVDYGAFYYPENYATLPTLRQAVQALHRLGDEEDNITESFRQLFLEHNVQTRYGLVLLHRHQDLRRGARLVSHLGTMQSWDVGEILHPNLPIHEGYVMAQSFRSIGGRIMPYEFAFARHYTNNDLPFLIDAAHLLQSLQVEDIFGIRRLDSLERGSQLGDLHGQSIRMLTARDAATAGNPDGSVAETLWVFSPGGDLVAYSPLLSPLRDNTPERPLRNLLQRFWRRCRNLLR